MVVDIEILQEYLDGELPAATLQQVEDQISANADLAREVSELRQERALRRGVWESYAPSAQESHQMAANCMAQLRDQAYAPLKAPFAQLATLRGLRRIALVAACLLIGAGGYVAGRNSVGTGAAAPTAANRSSQYVVRIEMPGGESVSQTFTDYAAAQKFARSYLADHAATAQNGTEQVAALQPQGVF